VTREKRLGRGLEALLGKVAAQAQTEADAVPGGRASRFGDIEPGEGFQDSADVFQESVLQDTPESPLSSATVVDVLLIDKNPYQPRLEFDPAEIQSLADSLQTHGLLQPLVVRRHGDRFQLIAGERRLRAALKAGWHDVPVHVLEVDDRRMAELALTENLQRRDLNAIEKAVAFQRYLDTYGGTHEELAKRLELDRSTVTNFLRLLDLPEQVRAMLQTGEITQGHARALMPLWRNPNNTPGNSRNPSDTPDNSRDPNNTPDNSRNPSDTSDNSWDPNNTPDNSWDPSDTARQPEEWEQIELCRRIRDEGWSVRQTEQYVRDWQNGVGEGEDWNVIVPTKSGSGRGGGSHGGPAQDDHTASLEQEFRTTLGSKVKLTHNNRGKGKLVISFATHDEFDRIYQLICQSKKPHLREAG